MTNNLHRINRNILLKISDTLEVSDFFKVKSAINLTDNHYILGTSQEIEQTVWDSGDYQYRLNKTFATDNLYTPSTTEELKSLNIDIFIRQGFVWSETVFGFHCLIKSVNTDEILCSKMIMVNDFSISETNQLISGAFWNESTRIKIPKTETILKVDIYQINYDDISIEGTNIGYIYNYTSELIPLIDEKPIPDFITTQLKLNPNHFLTVETKTTENKTLEQSILDYFSQENGNIDLSHLIKYGNSNLGYKSIRIKNETNQYLPLTIALDFTDYIADDSVDIFVSTEVMVDNKLMKREASINTHLLSIINPLVDSKITHPETNYPVEVITENIINNTIIETKTIERIIPIYQPIFAELIKSNIIYQENKNIYFQDLTVPAYLQIGENDPVLSQLTSDNKYYFNLESIPVVNEPTIYILFAVNSLQIIGKGIAQPPQNEIIIKEQLEKTEISINDLTIPRIIGKINDTLIDSVVITPKPVKPFIIPIKPRNVESSSVDKVNVEINTQQNFQ